MVTWVTKYLANLSKDKDAKLWVYGRKPKIAKLLFSILGMMQQIAVYRAIFFSHCSKFDEDANNERL